MFDLFTRLQAADTPLPAISVQQSVPQLPANEVRLDVAASSEAVASAAT